MQVLVEKEFVLREKRVHEECDSPAIGCSEYWLVYDKSHGSYKTKEEAESHKLKLINEYVPAGWIISSQSTEKHTQLYNPLITDDIDIWIEAKVISEQEVKNLFRLTG